MSREFKLATADEAETVARLVFALTGEISTRTNAQHFDIDLQTTITRCRELMSAGHYSAIIGRLNDAPVAIATFTETYALYAGGKIGVVQEFYVKPESRSANIGAELIEVVQKHGEKQGWACIELCTPPLPEFERTVEFYRAHGLNLVGGRKMRQSIRQIMPDNRMEPDT